MDVGGGAGQHERAHTPSQDPRGDHAEHRHDERSRPDLEDVADGRLEPDLEQQDHGTELGEDVHCAVPRDRADPRHAHEIEIAHHNARDQLAQHRRLSQPLGDMTAELRRRQHDGEREDHLSQSIDMGRVHLP